MKITRDELKNRGYWEIKDGDGEPFLRSQQYWTNVYVAVWWDDQSAAASVHISYCGTNLYSPGCKTIADLEALEKLFGIPAKAKASI